MATTTPPSADTTPRVPLTAPTENGNNVPIAKYYVFNETGNVLISSTINGSQPLEAPAQKVFAEVCVFYAGMARSIATQVNPKSSTGERYSLFDYDAIEAIVDGSGLFVKVTEEDVKYTSESVGANFSKELIEALLGLATGTGELEFASAMVSSIGNHGLNISQSSNSNESKVGNIIFVCENLLGVPTVSAIVAYIDVVKHVQELQLGPCFKEQSTTTTWKMHKDTYLFVPPSYISAYAGDLDSVQASPQYLQMISWFQSILSQTPTIFNIQESTAPNTVISSSDALNPGTTYELVGQFLPTTLTGVTLQLNPTSGKATKATIASNGTATGTVLPFTVSGTLTGTATISIIQGGKTIATTEQFYSISS